MSSLTSASTPSEAVATFFFDAALDAATCSGMVPVLQDFDSLSPSLFQRGGELYLTYARAHEVDELADKKNRGA